VTIGSDVWVGLGAIILPGVTIGSRTVVGAGSVVLSKPAGNLPCRGNPCRVVRAIDDSTLTPG
jgi:maltose O-acetyltransferase